jgi:hypothetical protein
MPDRSSPTPRPQVLRLLLVDPSRDDRIAVRDTIRSTDLDIEITATPWGPTAKALLGNSYDVTLVCMELPLAGELIHDASLRCAVIALSPGDMSQAGPAVRAGAHDLLVKTDLDRDSMQRALIAAIAHHRCTPSVFHTEEPTRLVSTPLP